MSELICSERTKIGCHPLASIAGKSYCLRCFLSARPFPVEMTSDPVVLHREMDMRRLLQAAEELQGAAAFVIERDNDDGRSELAGDILEDIQRYIPHIEREYYTLAQALLRPDLQAPRLCGHCGRTWQPDDPEWLHWDLCGEEECFARDAGLRIVGEEDGEAGE